MKKLRSMAIACCIIAVIAATLAFGTFTYHKTVHAIHTGTAWNGDGYGGTGNCIYNNDNPICW